MAVSYYDTRMIANYVSSQIVFCLVCWPCAPIPLCMDSLKVLPQYNQYDSVTYDDDVDLQN